MDINKIEAQDTDILENIFVALRELWKKKILIVLITIAGFLASLVFVNLMGTSTMYYSSATLFSAVYGSYSDTSEGVAVMNRYTDLISSSRVCGRAAQALAKYEITSEDLQYMVSSGRIRVSGANTSSVSYGYKLTISVYSPNSGQVTQIANAMASAFASELNDLIGSSTIQVMDEATRYTSYSTTNSTLYYLLFSGGAFAASCGIIFCIAFFSPWARSVVQCEQNEDLILGIMPYSKTRQ